MTDQVTAKPNLIVRIWRSISPSLVPILAVLTALIMTIPLMVITGGRGDILRGLNISFSGYAALVEGSIGVAINNMLSVNDVALVNRLIANDPAEAALTRQELRSLNQTVAQIDALGVDKVLADDAVIQKYAGQLDEAQIDALGSRMLAIRTITIPELDVMRPFADALGAADNAPEIIRTYSALTELTDEDRAVIAQTVALPEGISNDQILNYLKIIQSQGTIRTTQRIYEQLDVLKSLELGPNDADAVAFEQIASLAADPNTGSDVIANLAATWRRLEQAGITAGEVTALANQLLLVDSLYTSQVVANADLTVALNEELPQFIADNFTVYRPGNQPLLIHRGNNDPVGFVWDDRNTEDDPSDDRVDTVYAQVGNSALLFFPFNLERMLTRAIPYIIAGLAVALCFKAGLFNIGAEGQLYMGAILAVWVGYSPIFDFLPGITRLIAMLIAGVIGGGLWGFIPGALKAFTGAHEVINTIMLNFIAIRFVEWLIRSKDPLIMRDPVATVDQTPNIAANSMLPRMADVPLWGYAIFAVIVTLVLLAGVRGKLKVQPNAWVRPVVWGVLTFVGCVLAAVLNGRGALHLGLVIMVIMVVLVQWFLDKTTPGYALQTVGANSDAARYAGISVKWNLILAMLMAGGLAGLAGAIEMSGVQYNMKPGFFFGLGFDAISVALLARSQPRNMIFAGLMWGALVSGAGLMQVRADISIDLVRIIQALIILFIAADMIVRKLWRLPKSSESRAAVFTKGWAG